MIAGGVRPGSMGSAATAAGETMAARFRRPPSMLGAGHHDHHAIALATCSRHALHRGGRRRTPRGTRAIGADHDLVGFAVRACLVAEDAQRRSSGRSGIALGSGHSLRALRPDRSLRTGRALRTGSTLRSERTGRPDCARRPDCASWPDCAGWPDGTCRPDRSRWTLGPWRALQTLRAWPAGRTLSACRTCRALRSRRPRLAVARCQREERDE